MRKTREFFVSLSVGEIETMHKLASKTRREKLAKKLQEQLDYIATMPTMQDYEQPILDLEGSPVLAIKPLPNYDYALVP